ncbi:MAG: ABC transporter permease [Limisphaerales bacterium]
MTRPTPTKRRALNLLWAEFLESFWMAMSALTSHKLRSGLTLLGVLIGVFSIIVVMTAMRLLQRNAESELSQLGANTFQVRKWPGAMFGDMGDWEKYWRRKNISLAHGKAVVERASLAQSVGIERSLWTGEIRSRSEKSPPNVSLIGSTPGGFPARNWVVEHGRSLTETDLDSGRDVIVVGGKLATLLFPFGSAVGERVKVDGIGYTVVGVLESKGAAFGGGQDNLAVIPLTTGLNRYGRIWSSLSILVQAPSQEAYDETVEQVRGILRAVRKVPPGAEDDFEIFSNDSLIAQFKQFTLTVRAVVTVVSSIALLAAGIGIMNIMLVSVTERTREIGIRRAIGAKKRNIMTQFILEAIVLCEVGGVIGVLLGLAGGNLAAYFFKLPPIIPVDWVIFGLAICSVVGIVFGTYPAYKAANLDPIDSLRYE